MTTQATRSEPLLEPYRVLDLTDGRGLLCGLILADLGADVIAVEPPGGNPARRFGPFAADASDDPEASLWWASYARNRRSAVLDIESAEGKAQFIELVRGADFLLESFDPGYLDGLGLGLGYATLAEINPSLVHVSITPFGSTGPKAGYAATDMIVMAASGPLTVTGDADRAPLRIGVPQAYLHAGAEAACGALVAHRERLRSGRGQHVDVSAQQATAAATQSFILTSAIGEKDITRVTGGVSISGITLPLVWKARDGYVSITFFFGTAMGPFSRRLMEWMHEEGACDQAMRDKDWIGYALLLLNGEEPQEEYQKVLDAIAGFVAKKTKAELLDEAIKRRLLIVPVSTVTDLDESPQFAARGFWQELETPSLRRVVKTPGAFAKFSKTPLRHRFGAPRLGQHTADVVSAPPRRPAAAAPSGSSSGGRLPLEGLKVLDFMWVIAGPTATRMMADYGATVVKVESTTFIDTARGFQPFKDGTPGPETSGLFQNMNAGKLGLTLNLGKEEGRAVARDLVRWADIVCEAFSPKAMRNWGLDYDSLREINPGLIMMSTCLFGQSGPYSSIAGFGTMGAAVGGFNSLVGWPDRDPAMASAYTDYIAPRYSLAALLAALDHRDRTGEGQYIDLAQAEAGVNFLSPAHLDLVVNGREFVRRGNVDPQMSPHGVFPAAGEDRWVAIACRDSRDWDALLEGAGLEELAEDPRFATLEARLENRQALEEALGNWTRLHPMDEIERLLQARGVPAHQLQNSAELIVDPQLKHRGHLIELPHSQLGSFTVEASRFQLSRTPARTERPGPVFGEHNDYVLREILGYDDDRIAELVVGEVLE